GWHAIPFPESVGGVGGDPVDEAIVLEEMGRAMGPLASTYLISILTCGKTILSLGTSQQHERWLPGLMDGSIIFAFALTEPGAGSDAASITTRAVREGDTWRIN